MRGILEPGTVVRLLFAGGPILDRSWRAQVDASLADGSVRLALDLSAVEELDEDDLAELEELAQRLEDAGGSLTVTARIGSSSRATRTLRPAGWASAVGVHAALDRAILRHLSRQPGEGGVR